MSIHPRQKRPHNNTMNNTMNNKQKTLKKGEDLWITEPVTDDLWYWLFWLLCDPEFRCVLLMPQLPVIRW